MQSQPAVSSAQPRSIGRSIAAILLGFVVVVVLSIATDLALRGLGIFPKLGSAMSNNLFLVATAYRIVYAVFGSYITAWYAPHHPMKHALVGGAIGLLLGIFGAAASWKHPELGPHWYPLALVVTALPCAWIGGKLRVSQLR